MLHIIHSYFTMEPPSVNKIHIWFAIQHRPAFGRSEYPLGGVFNWELIDLAVPFGSDAGVGGVVFRQLP